MSYLLIIPAAGRGVRAFEFTAYGLYPKPFVSVGGSTVLGLTLAEARSAGIDDLAYIVSDEEGASTYRSFMDPLSGRGELRDAVARKQPDALARMEENTGLAVDYVFQPEPLGFGHAVGLVAPVARGRGFDGAVVALPDDLVWGGPPGMEQVLSAHRQVGGMIVMVEEVDRESAKRFGVVQVSRRLEMAGGFVGREAFAATAVVEKPKDPIPNEIEGRERYFAVAGRYVLEEEDLEFLASQEPTPGRELDFTPLFDRATAKGRLTAVLPDGRFLTVGNAEDAQKAAVAYALGGARQGETRLARHAISVLEEVGVLARDRDGRLVVSEPYST